MIKVIGVQQLFLKWQQQKYVKSVIIYSSSSFLPYMEYNTFTKNL